MAKAVQKNDMDEFESNVVEMGGNLTDLLEQIGEASERILQIEKEVKALNDEKKALREKMESLGIPKKSFDASFAYNKLSPKQKEGYDNGYKLCRKGMGCPISEQIDLFGNKSEKK